MEKSLSKEKKPALLRTFFFALTSALCFSILFFERNNVQLAILLLSFLSTGILLQRKTLFLLVATIIIMMLIGIKQVAENEDISIRIIKKFFVEPSTEAGDD
jgi:hypothetical protein